MSTVRLARAFTTWNYSATTRTGPEHGSMSHVSSRWKSELFWPSQDFLPRVTRDQKSQTLLESSELHRGKGCANLRDRAYSLITVSKDDDKLQVDYDCSLLGLAREVLRTCDDDLCLCRAFLVLQGLGLDLHENITENDMTSPFFQVDASNTLRHIAPCIQCGDDGSMTSVKLPPRSKTRMRCIYLHFNHLTTFTISKRQSSLTHQNLHPGHLILLWSALVNGNGFNWHLNWMPHGGEPWRSLTATKHFNTTAEVTFKSLSLSASLVLEIMTLAEVKEDEYGDIQQTSIKRDSAWTTKWKVAE